MPLSSGTRLGGYEILSALGAGGMGEVYRARDTRLGHDVALKILPQAFFTDAERVARFQREAKVLASLNHPYIAAIYGLHDEADGVRALVMELVEGEDLAQRLTRGAIPVDEALPIANQIAEALEAAHGQGIIHRDLKPANIMLRPVLAYVPVQEQLRSFVWVDRTGTETAIDALPPRPYVTLGLSRDGGRVAFASFNRVLEISAFDVARGSSTRLLDRGPAYLPRWAPDGQRIVFQSNRDGPLNLYSVATDGTGQITRLTNSRTEQYPHSIAPDGTILFAEPRPTSGFDIFRLPVSAPQGAAGTTPSDDALSEATVLVSTSSHEYAANISPNGRYFAYQAAGSDGTFAVFVRGYPDANRDPGRFRPGAEAHLCGPIRDVSCSILMNQTH